MEDETLDDRGVRLMLVRMEPAIGVSPDLRAALPGLPPDTYLWGLILYSDAFPTTHAGHGALPEWPTAIEADCGPHAQAGRQALQDLDAADATAAHFQILDTDVPFPDSPAAGELLCFCSRCREWIDEGLEVVRCPAADGRPWEYRYCPVCAELAT